MSIVTKTGDKGKSRWKNQVIDKDSVLLEAVGTIDELMAVLGVEIERDAKKWEYKLSEINKTLYMINGELAGYVKVVNLDQRVKELEEKIIEIEKEKGEIGKLLESGGQLWANMNLARTVCRRAERRLVSLSKVSQINQNILKYINRLSDYLFVEARKE